MDLQSSNEFPLSSTLDPILLLVLKFSMQSKLGEHGSPLLVDVVVSVGIACYCSMFHDPCPEAPPTNTGIIYTTTGLRSNCMQ